MNKFEEARKNNQSIMGKSAVYMVAGAGLLAIALKAIVDGAYNWGRSEQAIEIVDELEKEHQEG